MEVLYEEIEKYEIFCELGRLGQGGSLGGYTLGVISAPCFALLALSLALNLCFFFVFLVVLQQIRHVTHGLPRITRQQKCHQQEVQNDPSAKM